MKPYLSIILILSFVVNTGQSSKDTEIWGPIPKKVNSISDSSPPDDAIILFDGTDGIQTKENFGSVQLHIEWKTSEDLSHKNQDRSNSGVFLQGRYEIQILDSYDNPTYVNGQAGSVYKQYIPLVNSSRKPGHWQSYDIIFDAPVFDIEGNKIKSGFFTVFHNGVLIHNKVEILGTTENVGPPKNLAHGDGPLYLQNHCCTQISFRNIWLRKL